MAMYKGEAKIKDIYIGTEPIVKVYAGEEFCGFFTLSAYNLVANSDLLIDSESNGIPDGFDLTAATANSLVDGIFSFTATTSGGRITVSDMSMFNTTDYFYTFAKIKADSSLVNLSTLYSHSGSGNFEFLSGVYKFSGVYFIDQIKDYRTSGWTPIEVDYIGAINITDLVSRGILPSGLTNSQYQDILDNYFNS